MCKQNLPELEFLPSGFLTREAIERKNELRRCGVPFVAWAMDKFLADAAAWKEKRAQKNASANSEVDSAKSTEEPPKQLTTWSGEKPRKRGKLKPMGDPVDIHKMPPHSVEAERGVISSIMRDCQKGGTQTISDVSTQINENFFYVPAHKRIYEVMVSLWRAHRPVDLISLTEHLRNKQLLDSVGGAAYVTELSGYIHELTNYVPTAGNVEYYLDIVIEKFERREDIADATRIVRAAYGADDDEFAETVQRIATRMIHRSNVTNCSEKFNQAELLAFDSKNDPDCLVGFRWQNRGGTMLWAGSSGGGKSSLEMQLAIYWACGVPCFELRPVRALKSLIIQAENDKGDMAEQFQGVLAGVAAAQDIDFEQSKGNIEENLSIHRVIGKTGGAFLTVLDMLIQQENPDLVWIDPLFAFAGCDLLDPEKTGRFLREGLFPIAARRNVALQVVHHVGKPARGKKANDAEIAEIDYQYLGFGTSEIQNAFRGVNILVPITGTHTFKLVLSKRGERAGAKDAEGGFTQTLFLEHSKAGIRWLQANKPDVSTSGRGTSSTGTIEDLFNLIPPTGSIDKNVLLMMAAEQEKGDKRIGLNKARAYLTQLIDTGRAFEWRIKRAKTNPRIEISRHEQTLV